MVSIANISEEIKPPAVPPPLPASPKMSDKKKSGCVGGTFKLLLTLVVVSIVIATLVKTPEKSSSEAISTRQERTDVAAPPAKDESTDVVSPSEQKVDGSPSSAGDDFATKRLAPEGVFFLIERVSIATEDGIYAFPAGTRVERVGESDGKIKVKTDDAEFEIEEDKLTNNLDFVEEQQKQLRQEHEQMRKQADYLNGLAAGTRTGREDLVHGGTRPAPKGVDIIANHQLEQGYKPANVNEWLRGFKEAYSKFWDAQEASEIARVEADAGKLPDAASARALVKLSLRNNLSDPDSVKYDKWANVGYCEYRDGKFAWVISVDYRAKNAFGAYVRGSRTAYIRNKTIIGVHDD